MKFLFLLLLAFIANNALGQVPSEDLYVQPIRSTDARDNDYRDLQFLKELWKDKKLILLGEQSHGEGTVFEAKVRLIKFLHEEMGFEIVAFESGLYDNYKAYQELNSVNAGGKIPLYESILPIWSDAREVEELVDYIQQESKGDTPLRVTGFDFFTSDYKWDFWEELQQLVQLPGESWPVLEEVFFGNAEMLAQNPIDSARFFELSAQVMTQLEKSSTRSDHHKLIAQAYLGWQKGTIYEIEQEQGKEIPTQNPRDAWMAQNLIFLSKLYPGKKIIGWGASFHFADNITNFENTALTKEYVEKMVPRDRTVEDGTSSFDLDKAIGKAVPMGQILKDHFGGDMYSLAFSSYEGEYGLIIEDRRFRVLTPPKESLESILHTQGYDLALVDYSKSGLQQQWFYSSPLGNLPIYAQWASIFDGLVFMKTVEPPQPREYKDQQAELSVLPNTVDGKNIYGTVLDKETKEPIPYVNISLLDQAKGVGTNANGDFMFNYLPNGYLVFSCIGYESDTVAIAPLETGEDVSIYLKPKSYMLSEVMVTDKQLTAKNILRKARANIENNYYQKPLNQEVYLKVSKQEDDSITFNEEGAVMLYWEEGFKPRGKSFGNILQYKNTTGNPAKHVWAGIGELWLVFTHDVIMDKDNVIFRTGAYDVEINRVLEYEGRKVYDVAFSCKRPSAFTTGFGYPAPSSAGGHVYIGVDDYAVVKYDICIARKPVNFKKKPHLTWDPYHHHLSQTYKKHQGKYFLNTSFVEHKNKAIDANTTGPGHIAVGHSLKYLSTTRTITDGYIPIDRPLVNLKLGYEVEEDEHFWETHHYVPDGGNTHKFYC
ncbi:MAG: erythromycin esterase family protein, partial [Cytophagales bacterium]|nr:erythromycin esterase family protein [Cytophagales bacterium]